MSLHHHHGTSMAVKALPWSSVLASRMSASAVNWAKVPGPSRPYSSKGKKLKGSTMIAFSGITWRIFRSCGPVFLPTHAIDVVATASSSGKSLHRRLATGRWRQRIHCFRGPLKRE